MGGSGAAGVPSARHRAPRRPLRAPPPPNAAKHNGIRRRTQYAHNRLMHPYARCLKPLEWRTAPQDRKYRGGPPLQPEIFRRSRRGLRVRLNCIYFLFFSKKSVLTTGFYRAKSPLMLPATLCRAHPLIVGWHTRQVTCAWVCVYVPGDYRPCLACETALSALFGSSRSRSMHRYAITRLSIAGVAFCNS